MAIPRLSDEIFSGGARITGLPPAAAAGQAATYEQIVPFPGYRTGIGGWHTFLSGANNPTTIAVPTTALLLRSFIIAIQEPVILTAKGISVGTVAAGAQMRTGLYNVGKGLYPTTLIAGSDPAAIDCGTTGLRDTAFSPAISLSQGYYAVAYLINTGATLTIKQNPLGNLIALPEAVHSTANSRSCQWVAPSASTFGALPATYPTGHTPLPGTTAPEVQLQIQ
jgi:hypothetical protein